MRPISFAIAVVVFAHGALGDETSDAAGARTVTPAGICVDEAGQPLNGVDVVLYDNNLRLRDWREVAKTRTGADGCFRFTPVPCKLSELGRYLVVATQTGRVSEISDIRPDLKEGGLKVKLPPAGTLTGRVLDAEGHPVVGARVHTDLRVPESITGIHSSTTDDEGRYLITDIPLRAEPAPPQVIVSSGPRVYCRHPDHADASIEYGPVPGVADFHLQAGAVLEGRVVFADSGEPASGAAVEIVTTKTVIATGGPRIVFTNESGRYRATSLSEESYSLWTEVEDWTAAAIESQEAVTGESREAPDLRLVRGAIIQGRFIDSATEKPLTYAEYTSFSDYGYPAVVQIKGPARPISTPGQMAAAMRDDGTYSIRVPPGLNHLRVSSYRPWDLTDLAEAMTETRTRTSSNGRRVSYTTGSLGVPVTVAEGETREFNIRVHRAR